MSAPLVVHVGFHKCGSKLLQRYLGEHPSVHLLSIDEAREHLLCAHLPAFDPAPAAGFIEREVAAARESDRRPVLSAERLSGNPMSGHFDLAAIAGRLHGAAGEARIIVIVREQCAMIASIYRQYVSIGGTATFDRFTGEAWHGRVPEFDHRAYEFDRAVSCYHRLFGREQVLVVPLEGIRDEPEATFETLCTFMEVPFRPPPAERVNASDPDRVVAARRVINHLCRPRVETIWDRGRPRLSPDGVLARLMVGALNATGLPAPPMPFEEQARARFRDSYRESNRRLVDLTGLDLGGLGYEV